LVWKNKIIKKLVRTCDNVKWLSNMVICNLKLRKWKHTCIQFILSYYSWYDKPIARIYGRKQVCIGCNWPLFTTHLLQPSF
jgi:hypothetical protein